MTTSSPSTPSTPNTNASSSSVPYSSTANNNDAILIPTVLVTGFLIFGSLILIIIYKNKKETSNSIINIENDNNLVEEIDNNVMLIPRQNELSHEERALPVLPV